MQDYESLTCGWCGRKVAITDNPDGSREIVGHSRHPLDHTTCPGSNIFLPTPGIDFEEYRREETVEMLRLAITARPVERVPDQACQWYKCGSCSAYALEEHHVKHAPLCELIQVQDYITCLESVTP